MPYEHDPDEHADLPGVRPWLIFLAVFGACVALAFASQTKPRDLPPGCRMIGKFRHCDPAPTPSPSTSDPLSKYDDRIGGGNGLDDGDGLDDGSGLDDGDGLGDDSPHDGL